MGWELYVAVVSAFMLLAILAAVVARDVDLVEPKDNPGEESSHQTDAPRSSTSKRRG